MQFESGNQHVTFVYYENFIVCSGRKGIMRATLKAKPPILLCWPMMSEADAGGMAVEVEPSHLYCITLCCFETDGSRGAG